MATIVTWLEGGIVAIAVAVAAGYAILALLPVALRQKLAAALGDRAPAWLARRLRAGSGCETCPANALHRPKATPPR